VEQSHGQQKSNKSQIDCNNQIIDITKYVTVRKNQRWRHTLLKISRDTHAIETSLNKFRLINEKTIYARQCIVCCQVRIHTKK
jgi:hypothetical protein